MDFVSDNTHCTLYISFGVDIDISMALHVLGAASIGIKVVSVHVCITMLHKGCHEEPGSALYSPAVPTHQYVIEIT